MTIIAALALQIHCPSNCPTAQAIPASLVENLPLPRAIMKLWKHVRLEYQLRHKYILTGFLKSGKNDEIIEVKLKRHQ